MFVQAAAHDAGTALGAALAIAAEFSPGVTPSLREHVFLGQHIGGTSDIPRLLKKWDRLIEVQELSDRTK